MQARRDQPLALLRIRDAFERYGAAGPGPTELPIEEIANALRTSKTALWVIEMTSTAANGQTPREAVLLHVSEMSGGACETIFGAEGLQAAAKAITAGLVGQYVITYSGGSDGGQHRLRVGIRRSGVRVLAPEWPN